MGCRIFRWRGQHYRSSVWWAARVPAARCRSPSSGGEWGPGGSHSLSDRVLRGRGDSPARPLLPVAYTRESGGSIRPRGDGAVPRRREESASLSRDRHCRRAVRQRPVWSKAATSRPARCTRGALGGIRDSNRAVTPGLVCGLSRRRRVIRRDQGAPAKRWNSVAKDSRLSQPARRAGNSGPRA